MECSIDLHHSPSAHPLVKTSDSTNLLLVSCDTSEPLEPFKLSTLNSPISKHNHKREFVELSACSSPYPEFVEGITVDRPTVIKLKSASNNLDLFLDSVLRKIDGPSTEDDGAELTEYNLNFNKQMHRVKYSWRGTSLTQPFTFMRVRIDEEHLITEEDYSNKKVNSNDRLFN